MTAPDSHAGRRLLVSWVRLSGRLALPVLLLALLATLAAGYMTATRLGINTNTTDMLSEELPFRRHHRALSEAFPQFRDQIVVALEAPTPGQAADAARRLASALRARPATFDEVFYPEGEPFFRRNGLLYLEVDELQALADRLAAAQPFIAALAADPSLRGLAEILGRALEGAGGGASALGDRAALEDALARFAAAAEALAAARGPSLAPVSWQALLSAEPPTAADRRQLILLQPALDFGSLAPAARAIEVLRDTAGELGVTAANGFDLRLTGSAVMFQDELESVRDGIGLAGAVSATLVLGLLVLGLRSWRLVAATLAALLVGLVLTAGFATLAIGELNLLSVAFAVLFIGLSVDFGIHFALRYKEAAAEQGAEGADTLTALGAAAAGVGGPLTLCALAAALGFFAFLPTAYRGVSELGLISGVGMFIALFVNLTVLPAMLRLLPLPAGVAAPRSPLGGGLYGPIAARARGVMYSALALGLGAVALLPFARFDDDPLNLRDPASESVSTLNDLFGDRRLAPYSAEVLAADPAAARALARRLEALPEVAEVRLPADYLPDEQDAKLALVDEMALFLGPVLYARAEAPPEEAGTRQALGALQAALARAPPALEPAAGRLARALRALSGPDGRIGEAALVALDRLWLGTLPGRLEALRAALEAQPVTRADLPPDLRARGVSADGRIRVEVVPAADLRAPAARARFVDAVRAVAPAAVGLPVIITEAGRAVLQAFAEAGIYALLAIALLLLVTLRSLREGLLVLAPLLLAAVLTAGATVVLGIAFNFANVIVLPLLFGVGVASGIHMVARARRAGGVAALRATSTPRAVLFSALTTIGSFGALALSSHRGMASMGVLLTVAITLTLLCTLVVLPALIARFAPAPTQRRAVSGPAVRRAAMALLGLGLIAAIAARTDLTAVWARLSELGALGALAVAAVYMAAFLVDTASWQLMLPSVRLDRRWLYRLWRVRMVGEALNLTIPAGSLGGEPVKAVLLKRLHGIGYREGAASLIMAKTVNLLALLLFAAVGYALLRAVEALPKAFVLAVGLGLGALALGVLGFYATQRFRLAGHLARRLARLRVGRRLEGALAHVHAVDDHFERFYARAPKRFAAAFGLAFLNWLLGMAEVMVILWFLGAPVGLAEAWLIETVAQLVRAGFFFIPASLGASEAAMVLVFGALLGEGALGFAVALVRRARELVFIAWGLWFGWRDAPGLVRGGAGGDRELAACGPEQAPDRR